MSSMLLDFHGFSGSCVSETFWFGGAGQGPGRRSVRLGFSHEARVECSGNPPTTDLSLSKHIECHGASLFVQTCSESRFKISIDTDRVMF